MTTSLSKSTIPAYDPDNSYNSPRQVPRITSAGFENAMRSRGSLNIGDWSIQGQDWHVKKQQPKVRYEVARQSYIKNRGII
jgi:hypothetical protein